MFTLLKYKRYTKYRRIISLNVFLYTAHYPTDSISRIMERKNLLSPEALRRLKDQYLRTELLQALSVFHLFLIRLDAIKVCQGSAQNLKIDTFSWHVSLLIMCSF